MGVELQKLRSDKDLGLIVIFLQGPKDIYLVNCLYYLRRKSLRVSSYLLYPSRLSLPPNCMLFIVLRTALLVSSDLIELNTCEEK